MVLDAGFKPKDAAKVIGGTRTFRFELQFEDGGYELRSDLGDTFLFALDLQGDRLSLELIRNTESGTAEDKYTHSYFPTAFLTGHTFTRSD